MRGESRAVAQSEENPMRLFWSLVEDFFEQNLVMKAFIAWGWLSVVIMAAGIVVTDWAALAS